MSWLKSSSRSSSRRAAEWVTLGLSVAVVLSIAVYLVMRSSRPTSPVMVPHLELKIHDTEFKDGLFITPLAVTNENARAIAKLVIEVVEEDGSPREIDIEYLGEGESQLTYVFFEEDPRLRSVRIRPGYYQIK